jgi:phosphohistidine swiveling domain-containing protein
MIQELGRIKKQNKVGAKAGNLDLISRYGLLTPKGIVLSGRIEELNFNQIDQYLKKHRAKKFAVRSAALVEDGPDHSFAGLFTTKLNVSPQNIRSAVYEVYNSRNKQRILTYSKAGGVKPQDMSVIIQEMIDFDISGVAFSCHPLDLSEQIVINLARGGCRQVVDDRMQSDELILPKNRQISRTHLSLLDIKIAKKLKQKIKQVEKIFSCPQDIEFGIKQNRIYILQTRPLRSYSNMNCLTREKDRLLAKYNPQNLFKRTGPAETLPNPTPLSLDIIKKIYSCQGALGRALHVLSNDFDKDLWQNKDILETVYGRLATNHTLEKNIFSKKKIKVLKLTRNLTREIFKYYKYKKYTRYYQANFYQVTALKVTKLAEEVREEGDLGQAVNKLDALYHHSFILDLIFKQIEEHLRNKFGREKVLKLLALPTHIPKDLPVEIRDILNDFSFRTVYDFELYCDQYLTQKPYLGKIANKETVIKKTIKTQPAWQQNYYKQEIKRLLFYKKATQDAKHLFSLVYDELRKKLYKKALSSDLDNQKDLCFLYLDEVDNLNSLSDLKGLIGVRQQEYQVLLRKKIPNEFTLKQLFQNKDKTTGLTGPRLNCRALSPGRAKGKVVFQVNDITDCEIPILVTRSITLDLIPYFKQLGGIIVEIGNLLSHGAILAREYGLPTVRLDQALNLLNKDQGIVLDADMEEVEILK